MDIQPLLDRLNSFYKDYIYDQQFVVDLFTAYSDAIDMVGDYLSQVDNNLVNPTVETYRIIPYMSFQASDAVYNLTDILSNPNSNDFFPGADLPLYNDRVDYWINTATTSEKVKLLDSRQFYIPLDPTNGDISASAVAQIIDADIYDAMGEKLNISSNYIIENNKLYFLLSSTNNSRYRYIVMRNIMVDYSVPYTRLGMFLNMPYESIISRPEYKYISLSFLNAALSGPKIKNIRDAMKHMFTENFEIYDKFSPNNTKLAYWENGTLTDFDFLVNIPPDYSGDPDKVDLFYRYLDIIKPPESNFFMNFTESGASSIPSVMNFHDTADLLLSNPNQLDHVGARDSINCNLDGISTVTEAYKTPVMRMDFGLQTFDSGVTMDMYPSLGSIPVGSGYLIDSCDIHFITFPEAPVGLIVTKSGSNVTIKFTNNCVGVSEYRIFKNAAQINVVVPSVPGDNTQISYSDNGLASGTYNYFIRSVYKPIQLDQTQLYTGDSQIISIII